jgi:hypothetical protein
MSFFRGDDDRARLRQLALKARALPYDQRGYHLFENRDAAHAAGADPQALQDFDPTDEALDGLLARTAPDRDMPVQLASYGGPGPQAPEGPPRGRGGGFMYRQSPPDQRPPPDPATMVVPPRADVDMNIREAETHRLNLPWFYRKVHGTGPWDYKHGAPREPAGNAESPPNPYEDFGNYNYGATGAALGLSPELLFRAAGDQQYFGQNYDPRDGKPWGPPPYGDNPRDARNIQLGIEYYQRQRDADGRSPRRGR